MGIKAVVSDIYTTLIDIKTREDDLEIYERLASYLKYQGIYLSADELKWFFYEKKELQKKYNKEQYPEHDYRRIWYEILYENQYAYTGPDINSSTIVSDIIKLQRSLSTRRVKLYSGVYQTLSQLKNKYTLGIVSDAQQDHAYPELKMLGIYDFFQAVIVSAEFGYRKPDVRLFAECLRRLGVQPSEAIYLGNDTLRDIKGANDAGMKSVLVMTEYGNKDTAVAKPDYIIHDVGELFGILEGLK
ncbi:HAD family hydrolase [Methanocella arvoryzae]|uniref:Hydrolase (Haloacid dehalogenase superfamily) n=1 Tax=Methanocella arvoryzae (strain DSM 22066 / NBRC 105507 / MRE50) TaxID=351160 RepID=Q0W7U6_METAR|nr:HAD family hydrolase [Methanocella arvoryzae]CAJ35547.1 putative hydrolase (haloacid dehalogenase superfamily) [Methanocella arvoryzae MRE50]